MSYHKSHCDNPDIQISAEGDWPTILGSEEHWRTLFSCLLENACKFHPKAEGHVAQIKANIAIDNGELVFTLDDNGIGTSESQRQDIARPFKKLHADDDFPGMGMGLAYCTVIAEVNNASLSFDESPMGGLRVVYRQQCLSEAPSLTCLSDG